MADNQKDSTMTPDDILELAEKVERLDGPCREMDFLILCEIDPRAKATGILPGDPKFTASLDAAMTLVPEGWRWIMREADPDENNPDETGFFARLQTHDFKAVTWGKGEYWITDRVSGWDVKCWAATPALALVAASLRARATDMERER